MKKLFCWAILLCLQVSTVCASDGVVSQWVDNVVEKTKETWDSSHYDIYIPMYAWHNRLTYDDEHIAKYNENAFGFGFGKSMYERNNWHGLYAMVFKDSNEYWETIAGYAYQRNWRIGCDNDWRVGIGYTLSLTQRHEYSYIPVPLPLPIFGLEYRRLAIQGAYVPGWENMGNVAFFWIRFNLD